MKLLMSILLLLSTVMASDSKLLSYNWQSSKGEISGELTQTGLVFKRGDHQCQARFDKSKLYEYGVDQYRISLTAITSGCERVLGRNQRLEMEISNFDPQKKITYSTRVITRMHDEAKPRQGRVTFINSELLQSAFREKVK